MTIFPSDINDLHFVCVGYDTRKHMNDELGYLAPTAKIAEERCKQLNPDFDIYYTKQEV